MGRAGAGLIAVVLALAGCRNADKSPDREPAGTAAGRNRTKDGKDGKGQTWLDPSARLPGSDTTVPKGGGFGADPKTPGFNAKAEAQDAVGGKVVDAYNRPGKNIFIRVEAVDAPAKTVPIGIQTDANGYFFVRGLKAGKAYNLTAEATQDGKQLAGSVQTLVPNPVLTIVLRDGPGLPPADPGPGGGAPPPGERGGSPPPQPPGGGEAFPPPPLPNDGDRIPPMGLGAGGDGPPVRATPRPADGAFTPGGGASGPVPATIGGPARTPPAPGRAGGTPPPGSPGGGLPPPEDLADPSKPVRPENVADGPRPPFQPPAASVPGPAVPSYPLPPPPGPTPRGRPAGAAAKSRFALVDTLERPWEFPADAPGSLVLLEFVSTNCVHCKTAAPVLADVQSRYGASGLQVIAVLCDEGTQKQRTAAAAKYARAQNLNFPVYAESGPDAGAVRDLFGVEGYPTAVLLDRSGTVLWKGHPVSKRKELEAAVRAGLGK